MELDMDYKLLKEGLQGSLNGIYYQIMDSGLKDDILEKRYVVLSLLENNLRLNVSNVSRESIEVLSNYFYNLKEIDLNILNMVASSDREVFNLSINIIKELKNEI